ncbi:immunoglobulin lambda-1 light chain-like isoform X2 [Conger conger]|uniref:immunoglobulin lambda-1 light chain-like isoform X2 n=1 Tax=Conger conger TaxID=82655 RepID=UPI002A59B61F|nr:immunoglobulin lambda-1 light chain-like isoform X2 [Conger conger]
MFLGSGVILFSLFVVAEAQTTLLQEMISISASTKNTVEFPCKVSGLSSGNYIHWYHKKEGGTLERVLCITSSGSILDTIDKKNIQNSKYDLKILSVEEKHAGIYYCAYWDNVKIFGSGTRLIVSDTPKKAPAVVVYPPTKPQDGKTALVCIAQGMYPAFVRFKWKEEDREIPEAEVLAHEIEDGSASILIIDESKAEMKHTCQVEHEIPSKELEIPKRTGSTEREDPKGPVPQDNPRRALPACNDTGPYQTLSDESFLPSRRLYLASLIYTLMTLKSVAYFGVVSLLMYKRST